jgi:iron complex transport system substrate-binding protein
MNMSNCKSNAQTLAICSVLYLSLIVPSSINASDTGTKASSLQLTEKNVVVDNDGRQIRIEKPFQRIISLYGAHTENLFTLGLDDEIIGVTRHEVYPEAALVKPVFSYRDDPEKFLAVKPDLVLIRPMIARGYPQLVTRLETSGIRVVSLQPNGMIDLTTYWQILGALTGKENQSARMIDTFNSMLKTYGRLNEQLTGPGKRVYFEAIHSKMKTFSPGSMAIFALETAGGINIAANAKPRRGTNIAVFGKERILSMGADIDVFLAQVGTMNRVSIDMIKDEPGFQAIKAIQNNQIYLIDELIVSRPTLRLLLGIYEIGHILYPDIYNKEIEKLVAETVEG